VADVLARLLESVPGLSSLLLTGGNPLAEDAARFRAHSAAIVVATPGRLDDVMRTVPEWNARELDVLVLDEADRCAERERERRTHAHMPAHIDT
jgi:ATP-dependent RNA helicase DDX55/SPB4